MIPVRVAAAESTKIATGDEPSMPKSLLFDLDGTLIYNEMDIFLPPYFAALTKKLAGLVAAEKLIEQLQASTLVMMKNDNPAQTNAEVFAADFFPKVGVPREQLTPLLDDFYACEYRELRAFVQPIDLSHQIMERVFELHHLAVIATMPVFPRTAIEQRLEWGNLAHFPYTLITDYETMHASKPNPSYYREIAQRINVTPEDCIMVGNDIQMDIMPARRAGMKTFWITDAGAIPTDVPADWHGTLEDFSMMLGSL